MTNSALVQVINLKNGLTASKITNGYNGNSIGAIGFFSTFSQTSPATGELQSGAATTDFVGLDNTSLTADTAAATVRSNAFRNAYDSPTSSPKNPANGITLCFKSGTTNQYGSILLGGGNKSASSKLTIGNGNCP
jgi:hypothetical protein